MRKLKKKTIEECKKQLVAIKNEYDYILKRKSDYSNGGEMIDMATKEQLIHSSSTFRLRMKAILPEINHALRRIEENTYGICELTGKFIEERRLLAVPWTRMSIQAIETLTDKKR